MSRLVDYNVTIPCYQVKDGKVFFLIKLRRSDTSVQVAALSPLIDVCTTLRSYSQFRRLWKTLCMQFIEVDKITRRSHHRTLHLSRQCRCNDNCCEFDALCPLLQSFSFPSRRSLRSKLTGLDHAAVNERRSGLAVFLALLHNFFNSFDDALLRTKLQNGGCLVLESYMNFIGATEYFLIDASTVLHRPLTLNGWRQQCAEQMLVQDNGEDKDVSTDRSVHDLDIMAQSRSTTLTLCEENGAAQEFKKLPSLQITTVRIHTVFSFMEEFRENVLSQFASDINELKSSDLTQARRWEICLYVACRIGHLYAVQLILFNYADANIAMADGSSCLHIAARMGRTDIVKLLLDEGADVNKANDVGVTPLIAACRNGTVEVVELLLDAGASVSFCSKRCTYPLHAAIVSQNIEIVSMLVERGANVNVMTVSGITPLHFAAKLGSLAISEYLLRHDANPEKRTNNDNDAMMIAEAHGHATICELFQRFSGSYNNECVASNCLLLSESSKSPHMRLRMVSHRLPRVLV